MKKSELAKQKEICLAYNEQKMTAKAIAEKTELPLAKVYRLLKGATKTIAGSTRFSQETKQAIIANAENKSLRELAAQYGASHEWIRKIQAGKSSAQEMR